MFKIIKKLFYAYLIFLFSVSSYMVFQPVKQTKYLAEQKVLNDYWAGMVEHR